MTQRVPVIERILGANDRLAADNRARLDAAGVFSLNFLASPGAGKTSLVEQTVSRLAGRLRLAVIDGGGKTESSGKKKPGGGKAA